MSPLPPLVTTYQPATFIERGVAGPFTSALLAGARLRAVPTSRSGPPPRCLLEAVISNPSGGRGVYIVSWPEVRNSFRPTLHDIHLGQAVLSSLQAGEALSPAVVRRIARDVARSGFAGREVAAAAIVAARREESRASALVAFLLQQLGRSLKLDVRPEADSRLLLGAASARLGRSEAALASAIQRAGELCATCGIGPNTQDAYVPALVSAMRDLVREVPGCADMYATLGAAEAANIVTAAKTTIRLAESGLTATLARARRLPELLCSFVDTPDSQSAQFEQIEWLLDGWQRICLLWQMAETPLEKAAAISEGSNLIPDLPDEADSWFGLPRSVTASGARKASAFRLRAEPVLDAIARNEQLRAMAA